jgi:glycerol-3-phosphate dehydrogenase
LKHWIICKKRSTKKDYDVALIGCGAYGLPLASHVKRKGKQSIHLGGGLQLLFGIKGKRWDDNPEVKYKILDEPLEEDKRNF